MTNGILESLIYRPLKILVTNKSLWIFVFILILFNSFSSQVGDFYFNLNIKLSASYIFNELPSLAFNLIINEWPFVFLIFRIIFVVAVVLSVFAMTNLSEVYQEKRFNLKTFFNQNWISPITFYFLSKVVIYSIVILIAIAIYLSFKLIYIYTNQTSIILLVISIGLLYPFFYLLNSYSVLLSIQKVDYRAKSNFYKYLFRRKNFISIYSFYALRLFIEVFLLGIFPILIANYNLNKILITISMTIGLTLPMAFFRNSGLEVKLYILQTDPHFRKIYNLFYSKHYGI